jgi:multidrug efflux system membrane fusion protein
MAAGYRIVWGKALVGGLCVSLLLNWACKPAATPAALQTVTVGAVQPYVPDVGQRFATSISPNAHIDLLFKCAGPVESILQVKSEDGKLRLVGVGDKVRAGTELARVRTYDYEQRVEQARAALDQAKAQLLVAQATQAEAESQYERSTLLYQTASISKPSFEHAVQQHSSAVASIQSAEAAVANAQSILEQARLVLRDTSLRAPFTGWITSREIEPGALVGSGSRAFSMVDTHLVKATFSVPDNALDTIRLGQRQTIVLDALEDPVEGRVAAISQVADPKSLLFPVDVTIPNDASAIRPGMVGSLTIGRSDGGKAVLVVPLGALVRSKNNPNDFAVCLLENRAGENYVRLKDVQVGKTFGSVIEVSRGLVAGQQIVTTGGQFLDDGEQVRVLQ